MIAPLMGVRAAAASIALAASLCAGCAVHYFDHETGTEHVWGFGHLKMKVTPAGEGLRTVVRGTDVVGLSIGRADQHTYVTLGWHRVQRLDVLDEDTAVRLEWPSADFSEARVGSSMPPLPGQTRR